MQILCPHLRERLLAAGRRLCCLLLQLVDLAAELCDLLRREGAHLGHLQDGVRAQRCQGLPRFARITYCRSAHEDALLGWRAQALQYLHHVRAMASSGLLTCYPADDMYSSGQGGLCPDAQRAIAGSSVSHAAYMCVRWGWYNNRRSPLPQAAGRS